MTNVNYDFYLFLRKLIIFRLNIKFFSLKLNIFLNMSNKEIITNKKYLSSLLLSIKIITAFYSLPTFAKNSISNFKLRKNMALGSKLCLNHKNGLHFFYKLKNVILPSLDDLNAWDFICLDNSSNYNTGLNDIINFPEINYSFDFFEKILGLNLNISQTSKFEYDKYFFKKLIISGIELPLLNNN